MASKYVHYTCYRPTVHDSENHFSCFCWTQIQLPTHTWSWIELQLSRHSTTVQQLNRTSFAWEKVNSISTLNFQLNLCWSSLIFIFIGGWGWGWALTGRASHSPSHRQSRRLCNIFNSQLRPAAELGLHPRWACSAQCPRPRPYSNYQPDPHSRVTRGMTVYIVMTQAGGAGYYTVCQMALSSRGKKKYLHHAKLNKI